MKQTLIILFVFIGLFSFSQELELDDGIYSEKPTRNDTSWHRYSKDNITYKTDHIFIYDYYYLDNKGDKYKFIRTLDEYSETNPLNLTSYEHTSDDVIDKVKIDVTDFMDMFQKFDTN